MQKSSNTEIWEVALARRNQSLETHSSNVAKLAKEFASKFGMEEFMRVAGHLHDFGKALPEWQEYLRLKLNNEDVSIVPHSIHGARYGFTKVHSFQHIAEILGNIIMAHHGELYDSISPDGETLLVDSLQAKAEFVVPKEFSIDLSSLNNEFMNILNTVENVDRPFFISMLTKLVYSCLVDADRLDAYLSESGEIYSSVQPDWDYFISKLEEKLSELQSKTLSEMSVLRKKVSDDCKAAGFRNIGIYKLEVATGGGKTFASLRFALEHARQHKLDRIIYVIPYLSIISQVAKEIRDALGADENTVLEHHSGFLPDDEKYYKLQTNRWNAPIILTTQVEFLESLFSAKGSDLRKFHNMANSVLIFDEAQSVPIKCVHLFNSAMNFINTICKSTILLCTATQPPFGEVERKMKFSDKPSLTEYIEPPKRYEIKSSLMPCGYTYSELAEFVLEKHQNSTLVILNTKNAAKLLYEELSAKNETVLHLSTNMCSAHRDDVIEEFRNRLGEKNVICVSTQILEAGVDITVECVIRDLAGLDSIYQAAGRCNRHGEPGIKNVYVINIKDENLSKLPDIKTGVNITRRLFDDKSQDINLYYKHYFHSRKNEMDYNIDGGSIYDLLSCNKQGQGAYKNRKDKQGIKPPAIWSAIRSAADEFYVIDKGRTDVIVHYGKSTELLEEYKSTKDIVRKRSILKQLSKYSVSLYQYQIDELRKNCGIDYQSYEGLNVLTSGLYDKMIGINIKDSFEFYYL